MAGRNPDLDKKHERILEEQLRLPGNLTCADCGSKAPRWTSTNLGIYICMRCSAIHRHFGTHISKVKSVSLDTWSPEQVKYMVEHGNAKVNAVYEANLPPGFRRPTDDAAVEEFARAKWARKQYMAREGQLPSPAPSPSPSPVAHSAPTSPSPAAPAAPHRHRHHHSRSQGAAAQDDRSQSPPRPRPAAPQANPPARTVKTASEPDLLQLDRPSPAPSTPSALDLIQGPTGSPVTPAGSPPIGAAPAPGPQDVKGSILGLFNQPAPMAMPSPYGMPPAGAYGYPAPGYGMPPAPYMPLGLPPPAAGPYSVPPMMPATYGMAPPAAQSSMGPWYPR